jgi:amino acid transporter
VLTGILSACELLGELGLHRVIPGVFLKLTPRSRSPYVSILAFLAFGMLLYASASLDLNVVSQMFSLVWLLVMGLFPVSLLLLKFNRGRLRRDGRKTKLGVVFVAIVLVPVVLAGIVAYQPMTLVQVDGVPTLESLRFLTLF